MVYMPSINSQHYVFGDGDECYNLLSKVYGERNEEGEFKIFSKALACFLCKGLRWKN